MSQSPQRAQQHQQQQQQEQLWQDYGATASGWDVYSAQPASPFFDPAIVTASSAALQEAGDYMSLPMQSKPKFVCLLQLQVH